MGGGGGRTKKYSQNTKTVAVPSGDNCKDLIIEARILDPVLPGLIGLNVGDILFVRLHQSVLRVELYNNQGSICGRITSYNIDVLVECLKKGIRFIAVIMDIVDDDTYDVRIESANGQ